MKISAVNVYFVRPRWGFVEIVTDGGLVGWGEAVLEGHAKAVLACVEEYRDYLVGIRVKPTHESLKGIDAESCVFEHPDT